MDSSAVVLQQAFLHLSVLPVFAYKCTECSLDIKTLFLHVFRRSNSQHQFDGFGHDRASLRLVVVQAIPMIPAKKKSTLILVETTVWILFLSKHNLQHTYLGDFHLCLVEHLVWILRPHVMVALISAAVGVINPARPERPRGVLNTSAKARGSRLLQSIGGLKVSRVSDAGFTRMPKASN